MRTVLSPDEEALRDAFADFFANESPPEAARAAEPLGFDRSLWDAVVALGAAGMALPEAVGGGGGGLCEAAVVAEEAGAALAPVPLIEHTVAARLLHRLAPDHPLVAEAAQGSRLATLALHPVPPRAPARLVPAGAVADAVLACSEGRLVLAAGPAPDAAPRTTGDLPVADRSLAGAEDLGGDLAAWRLAVDEWRALTAAAYAGLAGRVLDIAVGYVSERRQFGKAVGSFQAVQHGLADAAVGAAGARLLAHRAAWALQAGRPDASRLAGMALVFAAETGRFAADRALQYHGGYGYAAEYDVQLYLRRALAWILQIGGIAAEIRRLGAAEFAG